MASDGPSNASPEERLKSLKAIPPPRPAYLATAGSPLTVNEDLYTAIRTAPRVPIISFTLPIRSGRAWHAPATSIVRISTPEGPRKSKLSPSPDLPNQPTNPQPRGRRPKHLVRHQPARTLLGRPHQAAPLLPPHNLRPAL